MHHWRGKDINFDFDVNVRRGLLVVEHMFVKCLLSWVDSVRVCRRCNHHLSKHTVSSCFWHFLLRIFSQLDTTVILNIRAEFSELCKSLRMHVGTGWVQWTRPPPHFSKIRAKCLFSCNLVALLENLEDAKTSSRMQISSDFRGSKFRNFSGSNPPFL